MTETTMTVDTLYERARASDVPVLGEADYRTARDLACLSGYDTPEIHALLLAMFAAMGEGSVCLRYDARSIAGRLGLFLGEEEAARLAAAIVASGDPAAAYPALVSADEAAYLPLILKSAGDGKYLYFQKYPRYERELKDALGRIAASDGTSHASRAQIADALTDVLVTRPVRRRTERGAFRKITLDSRQRSAVALPLRKDLVIISGGPGTGKTSIVVAILRCLARLGIEPSRMRLAAPTGRAARRMGDALAQGLASVAGRLPKPDRGLEAVTESTIHRLLGYDPRRNRFRHDAAEPIPADVVIVDEVSMIDIVLMARLFGALAPGTKLVLLGDKDQLPSVEAGAVLAELIPRAGGTAEEPHLLTDRLVMLGQSYRSDEAILRVAERVNAQDVAVCDELTPLSPRSERIAWPSGVAFLDAARDDIAERRHVLDAWISRSFFSQKRSAPAYADLIRKARSLDLSAGVLADHDGMFRALFSYVEGARILALVRKGVAGTYWTNRTVARRLRPVLDVYGRPDLFAGAIITITENDPVRGLFNGDIGVILRGRDGAYRAAFPRLGSFIALSVAELPRWELAFATTVHKSQGSEYDSVLLLLPPDERNRLLSKEIIYTALTRSRHLVAIYGSRAVLRAAIARRIDRQSGLALWK